ncbi:uncharacterized protein LOC108147347 [Drosophila elegans]|uniref:uncharacterized protein LOC108147347 n=1 Tax=Drosophila elegans TaxID=30023 RepID=UPI0007E61ABB|nr:uncharacterized protein LOC108147347 [Drosophila elegans]
MENSLKMKRASLLTQSLMQTVESWGQTVSSRDSETHRNKVANLSESTEVAFRERNSLKVVTMRESKQIVVDIVQDMLDKKRGAFTPSESECSLAEDLRESLSMDPRLKLWHDTLQNRAAVQAKIQRRLGRRPHEMLINVSAPRDRGTVERMLDLAGRLSPTTLAQRKPAVLPAQIDPQQCRILPELQETLPRAERSGRAELEVSGLTRATRQEILGSAARDPGKTAQWLDCRQLEERIERQSGDIRRVVQFFPEVDKLEVVGGTLHEGLGRRVKTKPIERVSCDSVHSMSNSSLFSPEEAEQRAETRTAEHAPETWTTGAAVRINGVLFHNCGKRSIVPEIANVFFECHPYQNVVKEVARVENVGRQVLSCQWAVLDCKRTGKRVADRWQDSLVLSQRTFTVFPGEEHVCRALFRPRGCHLLKQCYELRIFPNVVGTVQSNFVARLTGRCVPAPEYTNQLRRRQQLVTDESKKQMADDLTHLQASIVPLLQPHEVVCPCDRTLDEREVFNAENPGYHCERFDDLETLKALHHALKKPREAAWDLRLETIRELILRLPDSNQRTRHFAKLVDVQEALKRGGGRGSLTHYCRDDERIRSRFIYVRGCIGNGIQEWEELMASMELNGLKLEVNRFQVRQQDGWDYNDTEDEGSEPKSWMRQLRKDNLGLYLLKKLRSRKTYRDSLYMQTYSHLCDMAENVVSVIESTLNA